MNKQKAQIKITAPPGVTPEQAANDLLEMAKALDVLANLVDPDHGDRCERDARKQLGKEKGE